MWWLFCLALLFLRRASVLCEILSSRCKQQVGLLYFCTWAFRCKSAEPRRFVRTGWLLGSISAEHLGPALLRFVSAGVPLAAWGPSSVKLAFQRFFRV